MAESIVIRRSYQKPTLQVHGSVEELTLGRNSGSGGGMPRRRRRWRRRRRLLRLRWRRR